MFPQGKPREASLPRKSRNVSRDHPLPRADPAHRRIQALIQQRLSLGDVVLTSSADGLPADERVSGTRVRRARRLAAAHSGAAVTAGISTVRSLRSGADVACRDHTLASNMPAVRLTDNWYRGWCTVRLLLESSRSSPADTDSQRSRTQWRGRRTGWQSRSAALHLNTVRDKPDQRHSH